ncbi:MAG TPA: M24 family metallopeptidase [Patescibacteria group bacterium]
MPESKLRAISHGSLIIDKIFLEIVDLIKMRHKFGLTEIEIANQIKKLGKKFGAQGMAFPPIVSFGRSAVEIHHKPGKLRIGKNNFLMLDYGVKVSGYCSDFTRTLFIGTPNKEQERIYNIVLKSQLAAIKKTAPGKHADGIDFTARHIINTSGFGKFYIHGTGHGVGKKIHEAPNFKPNSGDIIMENDVVTVEPGIYLPKKFGVRIEDMILVKNKPEIFSKIPKDFGSMIINLK